MKAVEVYDPITGGKERLLKIKDLSEKLDWSGDWSADSSKWSPELKEHLGYSETYREGQFSFYMSYDDFNSAFNSTCIIKLH